MKIALLTIWHEKNYGAELQAYALIRAIRDLGHSVEMIDIRLSDKTPQTAKSKVLNTVLSFSPSEKKFEHFWKKNIPTTKRYKTVLELKNDPPQVDIYMVGSDQVWNPDITGDFSKLFFLNFGSDKIKRVSYASSLGVSTWLHNEMKDDICTLLGRFSYITCREQSGVNILNNVFQVSARRVLDPTLLHENYVELTGDINEKPTLAYYPLSKDIKMETLVSRLCSQLNLQPININKKKYLYGKAVWNQPSVNQWIRNIAEAKFVITRSFHGLAFCLIYKRQFAMLATRNNRSTRVTDLLELMGLETRYYNSIEELEEAKPWTVKIDYTVVNEILQKHRIQSLEILRKMLES